jgi:D-alanyl-lipoteichoic acid acyltransferase DltB (MBOAT superfamily)
MLVFGLSGLWHGAKWNFVIWGILHGLFIILERLKNSFSKKSEHQSNQGFFQGAYSQIITFSLITFAWIFFRASGFTKAKQFISGIFDWEWQQKLISPLNNIELIFCILMISFLIIFEQKNRFVKSVSHTNFFVLTTSSIVFIYLFGVFLKVQFIYFQF